jgi:hypothetical protein
LEKLMKRTLLTLGLTVALGVAGTLWHAGPALCGEGQGTAAPDTKISGLNIGTHWYGAEIDTNDLKGKVVLVEIWGS